MQKFKYTIDNKDYEVKIEESTSEEILVEVNGKKYTVKRDVAPTPKPKQEQKKVTAPKAADRPAPKTASPQVTSAPAAAAGGHAVKSPLPGVILDINCATGDQVKKGQKLLVLEAMKMENDIKADRDGTVTSINVSKGESVQEGTDLVTLA